MWSIARPTATRVAHVLAQQQRLAFSYPEVGHSRDRTPTGYAIDHNRVCVGTDFAAACAALRGWRMLPPWIDVEPHPVPLEQGRMLAVLVHALGVWWLNPARIVYVLDEPQRFGFAYGTLPGHAECGEERFLVEQLADGSVWYDVRAFSKPRYWAARAAYPLTRLLQRRFGRDTQQAMLRALRGQRTLRSDGGIDLRRER